MKHQVAIQLSVNRPKGMQCLSASQWDQVCATVKHLTQSSAVTLLNTPTRPAPTT